jgi:hypothetical protein
VPNIASLRISWVQHAGVAHLAQLANLKRLHLDCCEKVSGEGIAPLKKLTQLAKLNVEFTAVTEKGAAKKALPKLEIER